MRYSAELNFSVCETPSIKNEFINSSWILVLKCRYLNYIISIDNNFVIQYFMNLSMETRKYRNQRCRFLEGITVTLMLNAVQQISMFHKVKLCCKKNRYSFSYKNSRECPHSAYTLDFYAYEHYDYDTKFK